MRKPKFVLLPVLKYDVRDRGGVVIPAGTKNVYCKFRASPGTYLKDGVVTHLNVYLHNGRYVHGY